MKHVIDLPAFPARSSEGHKGTFGRAMIVAGSRGMSGAAILSGLAALRGGAGLGYPALSLNPPQGGARRPSPSSAGL